LPPVSAHSVAHTAHTNALYVTSIQYAKAKKETNKVDTMLQMTCRNGRRQHAEKDLPLHLPTGQGTIHLMSNLCPWLLYRQLTVERLH